MGKVFHFTRIKTFSLWGQGCSLLSPPESSENVVWDGERNLILGKGLIVLWRFFFFVVVVLLVFFSSQHDTRAIATADGA